MTAPAANGDIDALMTFEKSLLEQLVDPIGIILISAGPSSVAVCCSISEEYVSPDLTAAGWLSYSMKDIGGSLIVGASCFSASAVILGGRIPIVVLDSVKRLASSFAKFYWTNENPHYSDSTEYGDPSTENRPNYIEQSMAPDRVAARLVEAEEEGRKLGTDLMGGETEYFCSTILSANGDIEALREARRGMLSQLTKPIGVMLLSAGVNTLAALCTIPQEESTRISAEEWLGAAVKTVGGSLLPGAATSTYAEAVIIPKYDEYAIKLKDSLVTSAFDFLKSNAILETDSDDSDEFVYGDEDFGIL
jgi:hypothetical protein